MTLAVYLHLIPFQNAVCFTNFFLRTLHCSLLCSLIRGRLFVTTHRPLSYITWLYVPRSSFFGLCIHRQFPTHTTTSSPFLSPPSILPQTSHRCSLSSEMLLFFMRAERATLANDHDCKPHEAAAIPTRTRTMHSSSVSSRLGANLTPVTK